MSDRLRAFELRGTYLCRLDPERPLPAAVESQYNSAEDRYELPETELLEALADAIDADVVVEPAQAFTVEFVGEPPADLDLDPLFDWRERGRTRVLLPDEAAVERAVDAGGTRLSC